MKTPWIKWFPSDFLNGVADLSPNEIAVYTIILNRIFDEDGPIKNDPAIISRRCNMRPSQAAKSIKCLIENGKLIDADGLLDNERAKKEVESRRKVSVKQTINITSRWRKEAEKANEIKETAIPPNVSGNTKPIPTRSYKLEPELESKNKKESILIKFDAFWDVYPRKVGKKKAEDAYKVALKKVHTSEVLAAAAMQYSMVTTDIKFCKHPATWLNGECWNDVIDHVQPEASTPGSKMKKAFDDLKDENARRSNIVELNP